MVDYECILATPIKSLWQYRPTWTLLPETSKLIIHRKEKNKGFYDTKSMKDKTCVTTMVWFSADGHRLLLAVVCKYQESTFFKTNNRWKTTLALHLSKNERFDRDIKYWWIMNVYWPHHLKYQGNINAVLTLDNCTAHDTK